MSAAGAEPYLAFGPVDALPPSDHPLATSDLILHRSRGAVVEIEVTPTIAFRHPDDLLTIIYIVTILATGVSETAIRIAITKERPRLIGNECARFAVRVDFDHAINLMTALIVFKRECPAVFAPDRVRQFVRIRKERVVNVDLLMRGDIKQHGLFQVEHITRLGVYDRRELRLDLILGRRFDVAPFPLLTRAPTVRDVLRGVGRPDERSSAVVIPFGAVSAEHGPFLPIN